MISNKEKGALMWKYAMGYGVILGFFWVIKYLFYIASITFKESSDQSLSDFLLYMYLYLLPIITLSLYYVLLRRFKENAFEGRINYIQCISFSVLLFFFASLIEAVIIYIHHKFFIDPKAVLTSDKNWLEMLLMSIFSQEWLDTQKESYGNILLLLSEIIKNVMIGFFLSLIYGIFVTRNNKKTE